MSRYCRFVVAGFWLENLFFSQENQNLGIMNKKPLNERKIWLFKYCGDSYADLSV